MKFSFLDSIQHIAQEQWNNLTGIDYPFLRHEFLLALEQSGCVSASTGWQPQHLIVEDLQQRLAVAPMYVKQHSYGEFVFDHPWAEAYHRHGLDYYPKLLNAIPYTPCTGPRIAFKNIDAKTLAPLLCEGLNQHLETLKASSWHSLFVDNEQTNLWQQTGAERRIACHFHWLNQSYPTFDAFLQTCQPRKRKELKRERKKVAEQGIHFQRLQGLQITSAHMSQFYLFYQLTNAKYNGHGGYLNEDFFQQLLQSMPEQMLLALATKNGQCIAGALHFFSSNTLYGRYWGCTQEHDFLHFETCFYQGIEFCIENKLDVFDPGAQGEHKIKRGFTPILTQSFHHLTHPQFRLAVQNYLVQEQQAVLNYQREMMGLLPFNKPDTPN
ncbi:MAG: N-acetyltransferase [Arenimonas sp.]|nr:N-acetyltransferase [Arenimonas sp.]